MSKFGLVTRRRRTVLEPEPEKPVDEEPLELEEVAPFEPEPEPEPAPAPAPASASAEEPPFTSLSAFCYGEVLSGVRWILRVVETRTIDVSSEKPM